MHIEKAIKKFFKEVPISELDEFIMYFVYDDMTNFDKIKPLLDSFLENQGITDKYWKTIEYLKLKEVGKNPYFFDKSGIDLIQDIKVSLLSYYYLRSSSEYKLEINKLKEEKILNTVKNLVTLKNIGVATYTAITVLQGLNDSEIYFYGKEKDLETINLLQANLNKYLLPKG